MPRVIITSHAHAAIRRLAVGNEFHATGKRLSNGDWDVPLTDAVYEKLMLVKLENESLSDTIERVIEFSSGRKPS